jgi:hypothetical protein
MPYYVGLDLGQSADYTALAVIFDTHVQTDAGQRQRQLQVVHLERYPLRTSYPDIVEHVTELVRNEALHPWETDGYRHAQTHPTLILDSTGVGAPVTDLFDKRRVKYVAVSITGGVTVSRLSTKKYGVPKRDLVSALEVPFHNGSLVIAQELDLRPILEKELQGFKRKIKLTTGHDTYEHWREGDHDDLVLACALAVWWCRRRSKGTSKLRVIR